MRIGFSFPDRIAGPDVINAALEATTKADEHLLREGSVRPVSQLIREGRVRWRPEPRGQGESFDPLHLIQSRGWGDCDDLAPALAAELRASGRDPGARAIVRRSGPSRWHAIVRGSDGTLYDPSRWAGMGQRGAIVGAAVCGAMVPEHAAALAARPWRGGWAARCDLPFADGAGHVAGCGTGRSRADALSRAIEGACVVGDASGLTDRRATARALAFEAFGRGADPRAVDAWYSNATDGEEPPSVGFDLMGAAKGAFGLGGGGESGGGGGGSPAGASNHSPYGPVVVPGGAAGPAAIQSPPGAIIVRF